MRGIAIIFIVLHNLLHLFLETTENEFIFSIARSNTFAKHALEFTPYFYKDIFSFLGWYGVAVFLFLSGYGLTQKYGFTTEQPFKAGSFVWKHLKRVFLLMLIPYTLFAIRHLLRGQYLQIFLQLTLTSNIFNPNGISPGVFWFFGLIAQFYIFFAIIRKSNSIYGIGGGILLIINILSLIIIVYPRWSYELMNYVRHNFIGWLLPFSAGIWFAECKSMNSLFDSYWKNGLWVIVCGALVTISNYNFYAWCISPIFAIMASIGLTKVLARYRWINESCIWLGTLSSFLFAVHPTVRLLCMRYFANEMTHTIYILGYLLASIAVAIAYRAIHKRFLSK